MEGPKKPRAREKQVVDGGKGVEKHGEGLGTGPVNNMGNYTDRKQQEQASAPQERRSAAAQKPFANSARPTQNRPPFSQNRPQSGFGTPFSGGGTGTAQRPATSQRPASAQRPAAGSGSAQRQYNSAVRQNGNGGGQRASGAGQQGCGKYLLIIIAAILLIGGGKISGLFDGGGQDYSGTTTQQQQTVQTQNTSSQGSGSGSTAGGLSNLLSSFLGSSGSSVYDFTGTAASLFSQNAANEQYFTSGSEENSSKPDETVAGSARDKYTKILGNKKDEVTILVYMCGTDLESQQGMATADLKEMAKATFGDKVNLVIYTGGCNRWKNNVVSSSANQIYQIRDGAFYCLEKDMGNADMTSADTLTTFIQYGKEHFSANRMCLIFWDHGGGSVSGYGYDERYGRSHSMTLADINNALKKADVRFDFIGFDACLMATVENGIMLSQYADYMIASEETEPGVGWYYTNWLTKLGENTSLSTVKIGQMIADDFVNVCNQKCRGQATTLSVVDLAELQATVPEDLKQFSIDTNELIQNKQYKTVSSARSKTREFAQQNRIDQIDLVHFAKNMGTDEGKLLAKTLQSAVKYNRTGGGISNAYGLSIYFPYKRTNKVSQMVNTYKAIGMDEEYTRCIQEFASLEVGGQVSAGTQITNYGSQSTALPGLMDSLLGSGGHSASYSADGLSEILGGLFGGGSGGSTGSTGSILDLFMGRTMTADRAAEYILDNHFDDSALVWQNGRITLSNEQWGMVVSLVRNVFVDDGNGFIDLGTDNDFEIEGNALVSRFDGTWLSIDRQPVAYYYLDTVEDGEQYVISGYVPAILNGEQVNLILNFDNERPYGYIAGAEKVYRDGESDTQAKMIIDVGEGDKVQFICEYYDYEGNFRDTYKLGKEMTLGKTVEIANTAIGSDLSKCSVTYCFTDLYQQRYWTPVAP